MHKNSQLMHLHIHPLSNAGLRIPSNMQKRMQEQKAGIVQYHFYL